MAALVQSFPQSASTVTMLQARPTSSSGAFQTSSPNQHRGSGAGARNGYSGSNTTSYRGPTSSTPVAPYAFTSTPALTTGQNGSGPNSSTPFLSQENRALSAPAGAIPPSAPGSPSKARQPSPASNPNNDPSARLGILSQPLDLTLSDPRITTGIATKPSPDRYRRVHRRSETSSAALAGQAPSGSAMPSGSGMATVGHLYNFPTQTASSPSFAASVNAAMVTKDDTAINRSTDQAKRYRRRSMASLSNEESANPESGPQPPQQARSYASVLSAPYKPQRQDQPSFHANSRPESSHGRTGSDHSSASSKSSRPSSSKREGSAVGGPSSPTVVTSTPILKNEVKVINVPPRASSDASKRMTNPSPLSKPVSLSPESPISQSSFAKLVQSKNDNAQPVQLPAPAANVPDSPAAQQLAALSRKDGKKDGKSSRLRRAFSFGSAAELRKASAENSHATNERNKLKKPQFETEEEAREAAIVQQQEASGLGASIYSGQGNFFTGSTDNLSISSTASSASIMLRKMGKGVKKSTRSLVGLFRPKSVIGVPSADAALPEPSVAQVSMVTVEAEREKVNVNLDPHDQVGGGTGFPKLERNSIDAASMSAREPSLTTSDRSSDNIKTRRSIVGGERERAEVLAAVKKGILKRHGTDSGASSPQSRAADIRSPDFNIPQLPRVTDSPRSSAPPTPNDDTPRGHRRTESVTIEGEDYFMSAARFSGSETKSLPGTPKSLGRNISFSPRIQFHDTWTATDYDRRGEIATCNRLTPSLAQAIKEELNSFKMEMEVHESSKVYTHFF